MEKINRFIVKYLGWLLYPTDKQGKEEQNKNIINKYK
jgi:hypothetical protein